ncbi:MAG: DNA adenine methylase [Nitrosopumilaceae archaeon]|nr:DNA adenine methylase [Nitrosopumilaceae archaeon]
MKQQYSQLFATAPKPFVKWAGGKRQLITSLEGHLPKKFNTYFEPFLGGGALLFHLLNQSPNLKCSISDLNSDLILAYITIRDKVEQLIESLEKHSGKYSADQREYYYSVRESAPKNQIEKVSRLLFLNKTCFNGLYRVNSKGQFNVPLGRYTNPSIVNKENLISVSKILQSKNIAIRCQDFAAILDEAKKDDFVYFDPPYQPVSKTANFTSYTKCEFTYKDLERLADLCQKLDKKDCKVLLSNSNTKEVRNLFSSEWKVVEILANRAINSNSKKRTGHSELLIKNY